MNTKAQQTPLSARTNVWTPLRSPVAVLVVCLMVGAVQSWGATRTWSGAAGGGDYNWGTAANWAEGFVPANGDDLIFPTGKPKSPGNNLSGLALNSVTFSETGYTVSGNGISLAAGLTNSSGGLNAFDCPVTLTAAQTWDFNGNTTFSGTLALGTYRLTVHSSLGYGVVCGEIAGIVSGTGGLTKTGSGTLKVRSANNTYTGSTLVTGGTLLIDRERSLGGNPSIFTADQLTLDGGTLQINADFTVGSTLANLGVTLGSGNATITLDNGITAGISSAICGSGNLTNTYGGGGGTTLTLSGANTYTGKTVLENGTLIIDSETRLGNNPGSFANDHLTLNDGTTLILSGSFAIDDSNRGVTLRSGTCTIDVAGSVTIANVITGSGGFTKTSAGSLTLSADNDYSGSTTVSAGRLLGIPGGSCKNSAVTVSSTTATNAVTITDNTKQWTCSSLTYSAIGNVDFNFGSVAPSTTVGPIQVNGNVSFTATPTVHIQAIAIPSGSGVYPLIRWTGTLSGTAPTSVTLTPASSRIGLSLSNNTTTAKGLYLIATSTQPLRYYGTGNKVWSASNVWKDSAATPATTTFADGDAVQLEDSISSGGSSYTVTIANSYTVKPASVLANNSTRNYVIAPATAPSTGKIGGTTALTKTGTGFLTISTANDFSGGVTLSNGTLNINNNLALGTGTCTISGGTIDALSTSRAITNSHVWNGSFTFTGSQELDLGSNPVTLNATPEITVSASTLTVGGVISGSSYGLTKAGNGTLVLSGASQYTGNTVVSAGTLVVNGSTASGSAATVDAGATLMGGGTVAGTVDVSGTIAPGYGGPGSLNTGSETWESAGTYPVEFTEVSGTAGTEWDLLNITGTLDVAATSGDPFIISVGDLSSTSFDNNTSYSWKIATTSGGFTFAANKFLINTDNIGVVPGSYGAFSVSQSGNDIYLNFTPVAASAAPYGRAWGTYQRISVSSLLSAYTTGNGTRELVRVLTGSAGTVPTVSGGLILIPSPSNTMTPETFQYEVQLTGYPTSLATNLITLSVTNGVSAANAIHSTGNAMEIIFAGVPGFNYVVERSSDSDFSVAENISIKQTTNAITAGLWLYTEASPANPSYYRSRQNN